MDAMKLIIAQIVDLCRLLFCEQLGELKVIVASP